MAEKKYIEREALLERIDDIWDCADMVFEPNDHCCHDGDCEGCKWAETKNAIRKIIADFPAADVQPVVPKWIPVTERLPSAEKEVYVTDGEYIARAVLLDEVFPGDKPCWSYSGLGEITHWCEQIPLPQPPKEEAT